ncbi:15703_t:CDS:2, partial [Acaulospora colombiana]
MEIQHLSLYENDDGSLDLFLKYNGDIFTLDLPRPYDFEVPKRKVFAFTFLWEAISPSYKSSLVDHIRKSESDNLNLKIKDKTHSKDLSIEGSDNESSITWDIPYETFLADDTSRPIPIYQKLLPEEAQMILRDLGFNDDGVVKWNEHIDVPFGVSSELFVAREAVISGLHFPHIHHYPEIEQYAFSKGKIPPFVTNEVQSIPPGKIVNAQCHSTFPESIFIYKWQILGKNKNREKILEQINELLYNKYLLYRGVRTWVEVHRAIINGFPTNSVNNEFGFGVYTTPDFDYAVEYAGRNGAVMVFDWTETDGAITIKDLDNQEWAATVKGHVCTDKPGPPKHTEDMLQGPVSANHDRILTCSNPIPSHIRQVVGKTEA